MIFSLCSTTAWCTLILRDLSEIRYSWSQGQILKVKVTMRIKQKVMLRLYNFLWASWIAVIVRLLFVYNQWVCNVMTLTQSESHSAHLHYIVSSLYLFPVNLDLCDTIIYPDCAVLFSPIYRMFLDVSNSHFKSYFDAFLKSLRTLPIVLHQRIKAPERDHLVHHLSVRPSACLFVCHTLLLLAPDAFRGTLQF